MNTSHFFLLLFLSRVFFIWVSLVFPHDDSGSMYLAWIYTPLGFPGSSDHKESTCSVGDLGLVPVLGRSPREGNDNPLQYCCLENSMDRGAWWATVHGVARSWTQLKQLSIYPLLLIIVSFLGHPSPLIGDINFDHFIKVLTLFLHRIDTVMPLELTSSLWGNILRPCFAPH